jgi:Flp pilus assembly protein TadD
VNGTTTTREGSRGAGDPGSEAEAAFAHGLARYEAGDLASAHAAFERAHRKAGNDPRMMSWYGLTLILVERNSNLGLLYCDQALRIAGPEPELCLNQARAHVALGQRERAVRALSRGLERAPEHAGLLAAQETLGWRRLPVLPFLSRDNPLNRWLGKLRHRWSHRARPPRPPEPAALGRSPRGAAPEA